MAVFCTACGAEIAEGVAFCAACGASAPPAGETQTGKTDFSDKFAEINNTADTTAEYTQEDINTNKVMAVLSYFSWLVLIPLLAAPKSKFARFHANQGLALAITEIVWWIVEVILGYVLVAISWRLAFLVTILGLVNIVFVILAIIGIVNAANGRAKELPIIGKYRILK